MSTMKAPAGPPIWKRLPPRAEIEKAADDGGEQALVRRKARADGDGHRQRQRHDGNCQPGDRIGSEIADAV